jgi:hypothetical protein
LISSELFLDLIDLLLNEIYFLSKKPILIFKPFNFSKVEDFKLKNGVPADILLTAEHLIVVYFSVSDLHSSLGLVELILLLALPTDLRMP